MLISFFVWFIKKNVTESKYSIILIYKIDITGTIMKTPIHLTIELLKQRIKENLDKINHNQAEIRRLLSQPVSVERTSCIDKNYAINKDLLSENNDWINLHRLLLNFLAKYNSSIQKEEKETSTFTPYSYIDENELFELTVHGKIAFDLQHPKFDDENFFNRLLKYFTEAEAYEKCTDLLNAKRNNQQPSV
jgi:hypothetical protein